MKKSIILSLVYLLVYFDVNSQSLVQPTFYVRGVLSPLKKGTTTKQELKTVFQQLFPTQSRANIVYSLAASSAWYYTKKSSDYSAFVDDNFLDLCKRMDATGVPFVVSVGNIDAYKPMPNIGEPFTPNVVTYFIKPEQVEAIFQNTVNCVGIESGENLWTYNDANIQSILNFLRICKKYNKHYILGEGGWGFNSFMRLFYDYHNELLNEGLGKYFYPTFKNTKPYGAFVSQSALLGAWLTGKVAQYGTWNDEWVWTYSSFANSNQFPIYNKPDKNWELVPYTHYLKSWLLTISAGGTVNFLETPSFNRDGTAKEDYKNYFIPFVQGLAQHHIMPSKTAVQQKVKAISNPFGSYALSEAITKSYKVTDLVTYRSDLSAMPYTDPYGWLYNGTYGIWRDTAYTNTGTATDRYYEALKKRSGKKLLPNSLIRELIPNSARYFLIPLLSSPSDSLNIPNGIAKVSLNQFSNEKLLVDKFNQLYPNYNPRNQAWATEIDNSFFAINSHENIDIDQTFIFPLQGSITAIEGILPFQNILFGKREGIDRYWFQSNGFIELNSNTKRQYECVSKPTVIYIHAKFKPNIVVEEGKKDVVLMNWSEHKKMLELTIKHHKGAVNFTIVGEK